MRWIFASLSMFFAAGIVGFLGLRFSAPEWTPAGQSGLPWFLWLSTVLLVVLSVCAELSLWCVRRDREPQARLAAAVTLVLALLFVLSQSGAWRQMHRFNPIETVTLEKYKAAFYIVTGLHAAHVLGGIGIQGFVVFRACRNRYWSLFHPGLKYTALYWHFLGITWLVLLGLLWICR